MRQRVTIYFDTFSSVIIHWYEMESEERQEVREKRQREREEEEDTIKPKSWIMTKQGHMIEAERGRELPGPPGPPLHSVENRCPLSRCHVGPHIFVHSFVGSTVEASDKEGLLDSEVMFERTFEL